MSTKKNTTSSPPASKASTSKAKAKRVAAQQQQQAQEYLGVPQAALKEALRRGVEKMSKLQAEADRCRNAILNAEKQCIRVSEDIAKLGQGTASFHKNQQLEYTKKIVQRLTRVGAKAYKAVSNALLPMYVSLEWAGSGEAIADTLIDFDSLPLKSSLDYFPTATLITQRAQSLQLQIVNAIECATSVKKEFSSIRVFVGHGGTEITPAPKDNKAFRASTETKQQWRLLLKLQAEQSKLMKQHRSSTSSTSRTNTANTAPNAHSLDVKKLVLSIAQYEQYDVIVNLIKRQASWTSVLAAFKKTHRGQEAPWNGVVLEPFIMSVPCVIKILCDKWPKKFAKYIPPKLRDDEAFMASFNTADVFCKASERLLEDKAFLKKAFAIKNPNFTTVCLLNYLSPALKNDKQVVRWALWNSSGDSLRYASSALQDDFSIVQYACSLNCMAVQHASLRLRSDLQLITMCLATIPATQVVVFRQKLDQQWISNQVNLIQATATPPDDL